MSYSVYYNKNEKQDVRNIYWHDTEAYEEIKLQDVCTAYRVDTGLAFESEEEAQVKADALNAEEAKHPFENKGDVLLCYYVQESGK